MKKKLIPALLLSTVILTAASTVAVVSADDTDSKIASQDAKIASAKTAEEKAQAEVSDIQSQVDGLKSKQDKLKKETEDLLKQSEKLQVKAVSLTKEIAERDEALKSQARSAQTEGTATSYVDAIVNSKSLSDAVTRVSAMRTVVKANNDMMKQQKAAKAELDKTVKSNQAKANEGYKLLGQIDEQAKTLETQQAQLKVAQLNLAAERATAEDEKASLLDQKAAAQSAAAEAAAHEKAYNDQVKASADQAQKQEGGKEVPGLPPTPPSSSENNYPVGQCTWGAKKAAPWAGNNWGNGGQWAASAAAEGFRTGSTPQVGAIAVWQGGYGHVAVVTGVNGSQIQVVESNYNGSLELKDHRGFFDPGAVTYIYPKS
jgi:peptidoglycan hydrolase CwlO-like protein